MEGADKLVFEITERIVEYDPLQLESWRDASRWGGDGWRTMLPEAEWHRWPAHFGGQVGGGYHFVESCRCGSWKRRA